MEKEDWIKKQLNLYGKYIVKWRLRNNNYLLAIGPDYIYFIIGFLALNSVGIFMNTQMQIYLSIKLNLLLWILLLNSSLFYFLTFIINPGIIKKNMNHDNKGIYQCNICRNKQEEFSHSFYHCTDCNVCIIQQRHHCLWTGKCIGRNNKYFFYLFTMLIPVYFSCLIFLIAYYKN